MSWSEVKALVQNRKEVWCRPSEVWWAYLGENIGIEINGKGESYLRPVVVISRFSKKSCFVIPLTSQKKMGKNYTLVEWQNYNGEKRNDTALVQHRRSISTKRLKRRAGIMALESYTMIKSYK